MRRHRGGVSIVAAVLSDGRAECPPTADEPRTPDPHGDDDTRNASPPRSLAIGGRSNKIDKNTNEYTCVWRRGAVLRARTRDVLGCGSGGRFGVRWVLEIALKQFWRGGVWFEL